MVPNPSATSNTFIFRLKCWSGNLNQAFTFGLEKLLHNGSVIGDHLPQNTRVTEWPSRYSMIQQSPSNKDTASAKAVLSLLEICPLVRGTITCIHSTCSQKILTAVWVAVSEIFKLPCFGMKLGYWPKFQKLHIYPLNYPRSPKFHSVLDYDWLFPRH